MSFVTAERAVAATFPVVYRWWRRPKFAACLTLIIFVVVSASMLSQLNQYQLFHSPGHKFSSCTRQTENNEQTYLRYLPLIHQLISFLVIIISISRSKVNLHKISARQPLQQQANERKNLLLGPSMCFITQLPPLIVVFLDICHYESNTWFVHLSLILYYLSFTPQLMLFFLYLYPSPLCRELLLKEIYVGKRLLSMFHSHSLHLVTSNTLSPRSASHK